MELCGAITGQEALLKIQLKSAIAAARGRIRRNNAEEGKTLTQKGLEELVAGDPSVLDLVEQTGLLSLLGAHANAAREATGQYLNTISREISFRDAQMKARIY